MADPLKNALAKYRPESSAVERSRLRATGVPLDVVLLFDTTGSMYGYLEEVRRHLSHLSSEVFGAVPDARIGVVAYGDYGGAYVTKQLDLSPESHAVRKFIEGVEASSGGDIPEAVEEALFQANALSWRIGSKRAVVLMGDAPPHGVIDARIKRDFRHETRRLADKLIRTYTVQCGTDSATKDTFAWIAQTTAGRYLSLDRAEDLTDLIIGICMQQVGLLEGYVEKLRSERTLSASKLHLLKQLSDGE
jgi:Mg-chelatase subunit ChlD